MVPSVVCTRHCYADVGKNSCFGGHSLKSTQKLVLLSYRKWCDTIVPLTSNNSYVCNRWHYEVTCFFIHMLIEAQRVLWQLRALIPTAPHDICRNLAIVLAKKST
ncbi:hypothetical protein NP493_901g00086 [Ridgeia piscesae]|uniref:Uncharacterized protein n=1 Tax=Ridgeia piscesae TaxID=27915 RepID=A0AAD9KK60_RIDPI|nr:hypothetical protein NP493_901g00086 [Ridgeia piscesae]